MRIAKITLTLGLLCALAAVGSVFGQKMQVVHDPTVKTEEKADYTEAEENFLRRAALPKARQVWKNNAACGEDFGIVGAASGSFTRRNSAQRAFLYEFCQTGNGWANNGLVIAENGVIVAHFVEEGGWSMGLSALADINRNGFDELVVETSGGMHQGIVGGSVTVMEVSAERVREMGYTRAFSNECDAASAVAECDRSYKIIVKPSAAARPVFYREKYVNVGGDAEPRWKKSGKRQMVALDKSKSSFRLLK